jgi:hypothetical protein
MMVRAPLLDTTNTHRMSTSLYSTYLCYANLDTIHDKNQKATASTTSHLLTVSSSIPYLSNENESRVATDTTETWQDICWRFENSLVPHLQLTGAPHLRARSTVVPKTPQNCDTSTK